MTNSWEYKGWTIVKIRSDFWKAMKGDLSIRVCSGNLVKALIDENEAKSNDRSK